MWARKYRLGEEPRVDHMERAMTPAQRMDLVWMITEFAWSLKERNSDARRLRRDVVRVVRGGS